MRSVTLNFADWLEAIFWRSFWHIFWHSFWHIFWHSFWHIFWHSFWHIFWHSFWHIFWHSFWHIFWHSFWQSFDMLSDLSSDILSDTSKTKHSIHSFTQKPLHKLYIYLTPRSKSNIHDNFVSVKWQFYSCIRLHRTAPPRSSWVQRCKAPVATHTPHASDSPAKKAVESQDAMQVSTQPQLHLMACANHEVRCLPLCLLHLFGVTGPARHSIGLPLMHSNLPKGRQSSKDWSTLLQLLLALLIWNSSPFVHHMPQSSLHNLWHNEHTIPSMRSARRLHAHVDALRSNCSQDIAPHIPNSLCKPAGRANEDCRRTFHHKPRHGCQTNLTCLHTKRWATSICCSAPHQMTQH